MVLFQTRDDLEGYATFLHFVPQFRLDTILSKIICNT